MHLDSLTIKNFRLLEDVEIEKLGHVNLIVGKNNSGKSTVLEALAILASGFEPELIEKIDQNRNIEHEDNSDVINVKSFFTRNKNQENTFNKIIFIGNKKLYLNFGFESVFDLKNNLKSPFSYEFSSITEKIFLNCNKEIPHCESNTFDEVEPFFNYEYIDTNSLNLSILAKDWDEIILTEAEDIAIQMLQIIEPNITNLAFILKNNERVPFVRLQNQRNRVALHEMGDGIFRLFQIVIKMTQSRSGFLFIDELENGLHYSVQPKVWRLIFELAKRFNIQVFATTHSWDCIESFAQVAKEREDLDGVLFRMGRSARKSDEGKVIATVYDEDELYNITKTKMEVR